MPKRDGTKHYLVDEDELAWSGFMYDKDCGESEIVKRLFPRGIMTTRRHDLETVIEARADAHTIITSNGTDFIRFMREAQRNQNFKLCNDCWGLVWLPNPDFDRENALARLDLQHGITVNGAFLPWRVVGYLNLCVHVLRDGKLHVARFQRRCQFCEAEMPIKKEWYASIPIV